jgi:hypothetical protein
VDRRGCHFNRIGAYSEFPNAAIELGSGFFGKSNSEQEPCAPMLIYLVV